eukprot:Plantae.Rhodophyta-Hildenbrandia_rubra.ctg23065.p2 GENE.Plantae.Rhodophyta-Hildenbrandia_rubra.ctg23065~~Plantae.Rhodophyta-Hildenbrandia_rubra.ctg23065.p2  ORF type:complete len:194 (+),score=41.82 Plantae.Rhodophyta-Hildenbrandia_rubra.ctg23065:2274-2855(+)
MTPELQASSDDGLLAPSDEEGIITSATGARRLDSIVDDECSPDGERPRIYRLSQGNSSSLDPEPAAEDADEDASDEMMGLISEEIESHRPRQRLRRSPRASRRSAASGAEGNAEREAEREGNSDLGFEADDEEDEGCGSEDDEGVEFAGNVGRGKKRGMMEACGAISAVAVKISEPLRPRLRSIAHHCFSLTR